MRISQHSHKISRISRICMASAATVVVAAGCQGSSEAGGAAGNNGSGGGQSTSAEGNHSADVFSVQNTQQGVSEQQSCNTEPVPQVAEDAAQQLPAPLDGQASWDPANADVVGYDACAALSWIVMPIAGGTASSPYAIALFHEGEYLGRATSESYGFVPDVIRVDDATISVVYYYPQQGDSNANPTGSAQAQFHFDAASGTVQMSGEVPPE